MSEKWPQARIDAYKRYLNTAIENIENCERSRENHLELVIKSQEMIMSHKKDKYEIIQKLREQGVEVKELTK